MSFSRADTNARITSFVPEVGSQDLGAVTVRVVLGLDPAERRVVNEKVQLPQPRQDGDPRAEPQVVEDVIRDHRTPSDAVVAAYWICDTHGHADGKGDCWPTNPGRNAWGHRVQWMPWPATRSSMYMM